MYQERICTPTRNHWIYFSTNKFKTVPTNGWNYQNMIIFHGRERHRKCWTCQCFVISSINTPGYSIRIHPDLNKLVARPFHKNIFSDLFPNVRTLQYHVFHLAVIATCLSRLTRIWVKSILTETKVSCELKKIKI